MARDTSLGIQSRGSAWQEIRLLRSKAGALHGKRYAPGSLKTRACKARDTPMHGKRCAPRSLKTRPCMTRDARMQDKRRAQGYPKTRACTTRDAPLGIKSRSSRVVPEMLSILGGAHLAAEDRSALGVSGRFECQGGHLSGHSSRAYCSRVAMILGQRLASPAKRSTAQTQRP